jgi:serine/threonine protein kinase
MSPEQQERDEDELSTGKLNEKIDIYALGNILYKIAVGNSPWKVRSFRLDSKKYRLFAKNLTIQSDSLSE